jgi:predicted MFS family arabinose efflux permease
MALAIAQVTGWGTVSLLAILGRQIAADLQMNIAAVFAGNSVFYVAMGLCAPVLARAFIRFGARKAMMVGSVISALGFVGLALSNGPVAYFASWLILGGAGSATLTTASYIALNELAGRDARSAIGALMLVTGLSSSIFWPTTAFLSDALAWRATCLIYAAAMLLVCLPLYAFGLPRRIKIEHHDLKPLDVAATMQAPRTEKGTFYLIAATISLNAFVTFGFSAVLVELLKAEGLSPTDAVAFGSFLGVIQVSARAVDFLGGGRWDGIATGLFAGAVLPIAMVILMAGHGTYWSIAIFILLYGLSSGALAVARATIPLVFYDKAAYARAASHIALPVNVIAAAASPLLVSVLIHWGTSAVLAITVLLAFGALLILLILSRRRPSLLAAA